MKKFPLILISAFMALSTYASTDNTEIIPPPVEVTSQTLVRPPLKVTAYDDCGQVMTFSVVCTSECTVAEQMAFATQFINSHTNSDGCFFYTEV